jgi:hypothetical protein
MVVGKEIEREEGEFYFGMSSGASSKITIIPISMCAVL